MLPGTGVRSISTRSPVMVARGRQRGMHGSSGLIFTIPRPRVRPDCRNRPVCRALNRAVHWFTGTRTPWWCGSRGWPYGSVTSLPSLPDASAADRKPAATPMSAMTQLASKPRIPDPSLNVRLPRAGTPVSAHQKTDRVSCPAGLTKRKTDQCFPHPIGLLAPATVPGSPPAASWPQ